MYNNEKIYSIELGEDLEIKTPAREPRAVAPVSRVDSRPPIQPAKAVPGPKNAPRPRPAVQSKPPRGGLQFASLMTLTYLLGPFSVHLNPGNRGRRGLLTVGMISGTACLGMFAGRDFILDITAKGLPLWPAAVAGALVMLAAFSVWARAAYLAGSGDIPPRHKLPSLLRKPWAVGILGLVAPGLGLLLAGRPRRGAAVILSAWPVAGAALVLSNALLLWSRSQGRPAAFIPPTVLEYVFLVCAGILAAGLIGWIAQALEGARQMMDDPGFGHRIRSDWYAAALLGTLIAMAFVWNPATVARQMASGGIILQEKGLKVIPLYLAVGAHRLDPGPSEYAVRALALYAELGRTGEASGLRRELDGNLASYLALVHTENRDPVPMIPERTTARERRLLAEVTGQAGFGQGDLPPY